jgi:hypothetical protein
MPLTTQEKVAVLRGEPAALSRALTAAGTQTSVVRTIGCGDTQALAKALALTGPQARAVLDGDVSSIPAAVLGKL